MVNESEERCSFVKMNDSITLFRFLLLFFVCVCCHKKHISESKRGIIGAKDWDRAIQIFRETVIRHFLQVSNVVITYQTCCVKSFNLESVDVLVS